MLSPCTLEVSWGTVGVRGASALLSGFSLFPQITVWLKDTEKVQAVAVTVPKKIGEEVAVSVPVSTQVSQKVEEEQTLTPAPQTPSLTETRLCFVPERSVFLRNTKTMK